MVSTMQSTKQRDADYDEYLQAGRIWGLVKKEQISTIRFERPSKDIIDRYLAVKDLTTSVSDVLDAMGVNGSVPASYVRPMNPGQKVVGPAVTIRNLPSRKTPTQGYADKDQIKMATRDIYYFSEPGDVLVTDTNGDLGVSNMGGQSCAVAKTRGFAGSIVYGAVRDASTIRASGYPVWSCGVTPKTGKFRIDAIEMNGPVRLYDCRVDVGDLIVADDSGVCVIPSDRIGQVIDLVESIADEEDVMTKLILDDVPIAELKPLFRQRYK